jgi:hypothetical protein
MDDPDINRKVKHHDASSDSESVIGLKWPHSQDQGRQLEACQPEPKVAPTVTEKCLEMDDNAATIQPEAGPRRFKFAAFLECQSNAIQ